MYVIIIDSRVGETMKKKKLIMLIMLITLIFIRSDLIIASNIYNNTTYVSRAFLKPNEDFDCETNGDASTNNQGHTRDICTYYFKDQNYRTFCIDGTVQYHYGENYKYNRTIIGEGMACALNSYVSDYSEYSDTLMNFNAYGTGKREFYLFPGGITGKPTTNYKNLQKKIWALRNSNTKCIKVLNQTKYYINSTWSTTLPSVNITNSSLSMEYKNGRFEIVIPYTSSSGGSVSISAPNGFTCTNQGSNIFCHAPANTTPGSSTLTLNKIYKSKKIELTPFIDVFTNTYTTYSQTVGRVGYIQEVTEFEYPVNDSITLTVPNSYPSLTIRKVDSSNNLINSQATFRLYESNNCTGDYYTHNVTGINSNVGKTFFENYADYFEGISFSVKEITAPSGYQIDNTCHKFVFYPSDMTITGDLGNMRNYTLTVANTKSCEGEFESLSDKTDKLSRINLFKKYPNATNLLNFEETDPVQACKAATCNNSLSSGCLTTNLNTNFNENNLSCYQFTKGIGISDTLYCAYTKLNLTNNLSTTKKDVVYSGQPIFNFSFGNSVIANMDFGLDCYGITTNSSNISLDSSYSNLNLKFGGNDLIASNTNSIVMSPITVEGNYKKYSYSSKIDYSFGERYVEYLTGNLGNLRNKRFLTYGPVSKLKESGTKNLKFSLSLGSNIPFADITNVTNSTTCSYTVVNQIIDNDKLNLEFRVIDANTNNPLQVFPGLDGDGRRVGKNWCSNGYDSCLTSDEDDADVDISAITDGINSYGKDSSGGLHQAKYVINLTSSDIAKIRTYNDSHTYDEYDLECDEAGICESTFLDDTTIWNSNNLKIINEG